MKRLAYASLASLVVLVLAACGPGAVAPTTLDVVLSGDNEVPAVTTDMTGTASVTTFGDRLFVSGDWEGNATPVTGAHVHGPADETENAGIVFPLNFGNDTNSFSGSFVMDATQAEWFQQNQLYINVHTEENPGGEIRGQIVHP